MQEKMAKMLNDSVVARWTALILIALMMFFAYMFVDVMSPLKSLIESARGWDSGWPVSSWTRWVSALPELSPPP